MSKRSYHARSEQARMDVDIEIDGLDYVIDVFIKVMDDNILGRAEGYRADYLAQFASQMVDEYVENFSDDTRLNATSKTFFERYTGELPPGGPGLGPLNWELRVVFGYFVNTNEAVGPDWIEIKGMVSDQESA